MTLAYHHLNDAPWDTPVDADEFEWIVTEYECYGYDGNGSAVGLHSDGKLYTAALGHCSCHGPFDGRMRTGSGITPEDYLRDLDDAICETPRLKRKVAELLGIVELKESL